MRALRQYPEDKGAEITGDVESLAELDRGEIVSAEDLRHRTEEVITAAEKARLEQQVSQFPNSGAPGVLPGTRRLILGDYIMFYPTRG